MPSATETAKRATPPFRLVLDQSGFDRAVERRGLKSDREIARELRLEQSTVSRIRGGRVTPSSSFVATVLSTWRSERFEDLFACEQVRVE